jgi:TRAP-type C4-dicarboxylate transport system permease small subunit
VSDEDYQPVAGDHGRILRGLVAVDRALAASERFVLAGSVILMAAVMSGHVLARQLSQMAPDLLAPVIGGGIPGHQEIAEILIIVITFLGVSYGAACARHISMAAIYDQLSGIPRKTLLVAISLGTGALMFYLAWQSLLYVQDQRGDGGVYSALQLEKWLVYTVLPVGFTLAGVRYLLTALRNLTTTGMWRSLTEREAYEGVPRGGSGSGQI